VGWGHGHAALADALRRTLRRSGLRPRDIQIIVSGASGSRAGDHLESLTLRRAWDGEPLPPGVAPKGVTGEHGGGFLAAAVLAARGAELGPSPGFRTADPALGVTPHPGGRLPERRHVLVTSLAAGGAAAWLVLEAA
jgi:3-oxoacyl-(acyl-carrier-protein) synthase